VICICDVIIGIGGMYGVYKIDRCCFISFQILVMLLFCVVLYCVALRCDVLYFTSLTIAISKNLIGLSKTLNQEIINFIVRIYRIPFYFY
jgi:hypothetical protein